MNYRWKEYWERIRNGNKHIFLMLALAMVGLALIIYSPAEKDPENISLPPEVTPDTRSMQEIRAMAKEEQDLARSLETMLERIHGVGDVKVSVRLGESTNSHYAFNSEGGEKIIEEKDQSGGVRTTTENSEREELVLVQGPQGSEKPVIQREIAPQIAGVMIVAQGATDPEVKASLFQAVQVSLGVDPHRVIVLPMEGRDG